MARRLIALGIVGWWLVMMATLVRRWMREVQPQYQPGTYLPMLTEERRNYRERMGIYWGRQRVGHSETLFSYRDDGSHAIENVTVLKIAVPGFPAQATAFELGTTVVVGADRKSLQSLLIRLDSPLMRIHCPGGVVGGKLVLRPRIDGAPREPIELAIPSGEVIAQGLSPLTALPPLRVGMKWSAMAIDPFTLESAELQMEVLRREALEWNDQTVDAHVVRVRSGMWMEALAWVSPDGEVLRQRLPLLGLVLVREPVLQRGRGAGKGPAAPKG